LDRRVLKVDPGPLGGFVWIRTDDDVGIQQLLSTLTLV
jgi:hypothetical protein